MISKTIPIAILAAASLAGAQPVMPTMKPMTPGSPSLLQLPPVSMNAGAQAVSMYAGGQTVSVSSGGQTVTSSSSKTVTSSNGKTVTMSSGAPVKDDLFAGTERFAQGASETTEVNLNPDMMTMIGSHGGHKDASLAKKMKFMIIRSYKYDKPGMYKMEDVETYRRKLDDGSWQCAVRVREKNESTDICSRLAADHETHEMVILTAEPTELTFIHMSGQMSMEDLGKAAGEVGKAAGDLGKTAGKMGKATGDMDRSEGELHQRH